MVRLILLLLTLSTFAVFFTLHKKGLTLNKISVEWKGGNVALYGINYGEGKLTVDVLTLKLKKSPSSALRREPKIDGDIVKEWLHLLGEVLSRLPVKVRIKDVFLNFGNATVNIYGISFERNNLSADFVETFTGVKRNFSVEGVKIYGNRYFYGASARFFLRNSEGFIFLSVEPSEGRLNFRVPFRVGGEKFSLGGKVDLRKRIVGTAGLFGKKLNVSSRFSLGESKLNVSGKILYGNFSGKFSLGGFLTAPDYGLKGKVVFCNREALITVRGNVERVFLAFLGDGIYGSGYFDFETLQGRVIATSPGEGSLALSVERKTVSLRSDKFQIRNLCGLNVSDLNLKGVLFGGELSVRGNFSTLRFGPVGVEEESFRLYSKGDAAMLSLSGDAKGLLLLKGQNFWGYLFGRLKLSEKVIAFSLPQVEGLLKEKSKLLYISVRNVSYDGFSAEDFSLKIHSEKGRVYADFTGNLEGSLKLSLFGSYPYSLRIKGDIYGNERIIPIALEAKGNLLRGVARARVENLEGTVDYKKVARKYLSDLQLTYDGFRLNLSSVWKGGSLSFKGTLAFFFPDWSIYGTVPLEGFYSGNGWGLKGFPFCIYQLDRTITCIKHFSVSGGEGEIILSVDSAERLPVELFIRAVVKQEHLNFRTKAVISTEFINSFLTDYSTLIKSPKTLALEAYYDGRLAEFLDKFNWSFNRKLTLYSAYFYKPVDLYLSLFYKNRNFSGFLGLADAVGGEPFGSLSFEYPYGETFKASFELENLPFRFAVEDFVDSYLKVGIKGNFIPGGEPTLNSTLSVGGYLNVLSYNVPLKEGSGEEGKTLTVKTDVSFFSAEPLYVKTPDGNFILTFNGKLKGHNRYVNLSVNYGKLKLLDREYYVSGAKIKVENDKTYLYLPLTYYAPDRTIYLKIYGYLPWQNLKLEVRSTPPAPKEELLIYLVSGGQSGKGGLVGQGLSQLPLADLLLRTASVGMVGLLNKLSSAFVSGLKVSFVPTFDPTEGMVVGVDIEKFFGDFARLGYRWMPSKDPKATYLWGSMRFLFNSFLRFVRYSDGSTAATLRFSKELGLPF